MNSRSIFLVQVITKNFNCVIFILCSAKYNCFFCSIFTLINNPLLIINNEPFIMQQSHAFSAECRGLGVAEMAWSMRRGRKNRANKEMAYHALEVLWGMVKSSETKSTQRMQSSFEKMPPIPRGYSGQTYFEFVEEAGIAV